MNTRKVEIEKDRIRFEDHIHPGGMWSHIMKRNTTLRIIDTDGGANVGALFYNPENYNERYNMADTLKAQHIGRLCYPYVLYSDMGRIFCSITADSLGWHDTICGTTSKEIVKEKHGEGDYQELRNKFYRNGRDNFLIELGKYGLGKSDIVPNANFFSKVQVADVETGDFSFVQGHSKAGDYIDLRFEMDVLTILQTCPHPLDPREKYNPGRISLIVYKSDPPNQDDPSRTIRPENDRGFINTERYYL